jgi:hypothetical protein
MACPSLHSSLATHGSVPRIGSSQQDKKNNNQKVGSHSGKCEEPEAEFVVVIGLFGTEWSKQKGETVSSRVGIVVSSTVPSWYCTVPRGKKCTHHELLLQMRLCSVIFGLLRGK